MRKSRELGLKEGPRSVIFHQDLSTFPNNERYAFLSVRRLRRRTLKNALVSSFRIDIKCFLQVEVLKFIM